MAESENPELVSADNAAADVLHQLAKTVHWAAFMLGRDGVRNPILELAAHALEAGFIEVRPSHDSADGARIDWLEQTRPTLKANLQAGTGLYFVDIGTARFARPTLRGAIDAARGVEDVQGPETVRLPSLAPAL